ncbi:MAG: (d)CMP kinase [Planctomycetes bacterium]|nr:(d)CMP kinase [Planctomycetota bacterium]
MIVTIDGPAGAGKSSVAKKLAKELGYQFLDTGAMYRCVTLACLKRGIPLGELDKVAEEAQRIKIELFDDEVFLDGKNVTEEIRTPRITKAIKQVADNLRVRAAMVQSQRQWIQGKNAVTEGRDQGTIAFPDAPCKIFLTASPTERARRRVRQLLLAGIDADFDEILRLQEERDKNDMERETGGLRPAPNALTVQTDGMDESQVLQKLLEIVRAKAQTNL